MHEIATIRSLMIVAVMSLPATPEAQTDRIFDCEVDKAQPRTISVGESRVSLLFQDGTEFALARIRSGKPGWIVGSVQDVEKNIRVEALLNPDSGEHSMLLQAIEGSHDPIRVDGICVERTADNKPVRKVTLICTDEKMCDAFFGCRPPVDALPKSHRIEIELNHEAAQIDDHDASWTEISPTTVFISMSGGTLWTIDRGDNTFSRAVKIDPPLNNMTISGRCRLGDALW